MKKKLLPLFAFAVLAAGLTSCKKDFTCDCSYTDDDGEVISIPTTIENSRRPEASISCEALEIGYSMWADGKCKLK